MSLGGYYARLFITQYGDKTEQQCSTETMRKDNDVR